MDAEDKGEKYFSCTDTERAAFEAGIKLGTIFHQFIGAPISRSNVDDMEKTIEKCARIQPFVEDVEVKINRDLLHDKKDIYDYYTLYANMLEVHIELKYRDVLIIAEMREIEDLSYPLMYIKEIRKR